MDDNCVNTISNKEIIRQLINFAMKHRRIMQSYLDETGVYQAQHRLLMTISLNPNASQIELARMLDVSAATVAVSLRKLEKDGYINRDKDDDDNRFNIITITEKGNQVVEKSKEIFEATDRKVLEGFTEEEKQTLFLLLQKLNANLARMEEEKNRKERV